MNKQLEQSEIQNIKKPPHSLEAEQSVLGGLLLDADVWDIVASQINEQDFYHPRHKVIFCSMLKSVNENIPIDALTLCDTLERSGDLEKAGSVAYVTELASNVAGISNLAAYTKIIHEKSVLRQLIAVSQSISNSAFSPEGLSSQDVLNDAERLVFNIAQHQGEKTGPRVVREILDKTIDKIDELFNSKSDLTGLTTGFVDLDSMTSGLQPSDLIVLAARPSMGKTSLAMNLVENALMNTKKNIVVFSLEMSSEQLMMRMLSSLGRINQSKIRSGNLEEEDWPKLVSVVERLKDKSLFIDDTASISPMEVLSRTRRIARENGEIGLIMIDYLQLMKIPNYDQGRTNEVSEISRSLKAIAKEFNTPILALSQLNRSLEQRPNKRPVNADLRESGAIEQDADLILFIYRDEVYNPDSEQKGIGEIIIGKQRNGPVGSVKLAFLGQFTRFENLAHDYYQIDE